MNINGHTRCLKRIRDGAGGANDTSGPNTTSIALPNTRLDFAYPQAFERTKKMAVSGMLKPGRSWRQAAGTSVMQPLPQAGERWSWESGQATAIKSARTIRPTLTGLP